LVCRYLGEGDADIATHIHLYIDGELESISARRSARPFADSPTPEARVRELRLGGGTGYRGNIAYFEGWMDEFSFFNSAISSTKIQKIAGDASDLGRVVE